MVDAEAGAVEAAPNVLEPPDNAQDMARLALGLWLRAVWTDRAVPYPAAFYEKLVEICFSSDIYMAQDLSGLDVGSMRLESPGQRKSLQAAVNKANLEWPEQQTSPLVQTDTSSSGTLDLLERLRKPEPVVQIDLQEALTSLGLGNLAEECWPCGAATDKLCAAAEKLKKSKKTPFVFVHLAAFLPAHARSSENKEDDEVPESETVRTLQKVMGVKKPKKTLAFLACLEALDRYVIAGAACKQFEFTSGLAHLAMGKQGDGRWEASGHSCDL